MLIWARLCLGLVILALPGQARAVIFHSTADAEYNTTAPEGALTNSGWQLEGEWGAFLGTPIAPYYFITAAHVGGEIGQEFWLNGVRYVTKAGYTDTGSDLKIWRVLPRFPAYAELYTASDEKGKNLVVFGRGTQRGAAVEVSDFLGSVTKGWLWGTLDGRKRWGENKVEDIIDADGSGWSILMGAATATGYFLRATFDAGAGPNESHLSVGDSGGAVFINDGTIWKLAGINLAVDGPYNTSATGSGFFGAIFDEGGLYKGGEGKWLLTPELPANQAGAFYATRISTRTQWIRSILDQALPDPTPILQSSISPEGGFADDPGAQVDPVQMIIRVPIPPDVRFYRLRGTEPMSIANSRREGNTLILTCQYQ